jgi:branched-chain amino acid transport system ATP-binding protein
MKILEVDNIHTYYGDSHVIQGLSLYVNRGEAVSIIGRNGVGKTTTLRSIMGLTPPKRGTIKINGEDSTKWPPNKVVVKGGVAYIPAERHIFPGVSVEENLRIAERKSEKKDQWNLELIYDKFPILAERRKQDGATLSGGEQQVLAIGRGLMSNPSIMILDEPSQGLAPLIVETVVDTIKQLCKNEELTLILVEQNYHVAIDLASRHYLMEIKGKIACDMSSQECQDDLEILIKHLGV